MAFVVAGGVEGEMNDGARWVKGMEGQWVVLPETVVNGSRRRWGGSLVAIEAALGFDAAESLRDEAEAARRRGEESVEWPS